LGKQNVQAKKVFSKRRYQKLGIAARVLHTHRTWSFHVFLEEKLQKNVPRFKRTCTAIALTDDLIKGMKYIDKTRELR